MPTREIKKPKGVVSRALSETTGVSVIPVGGNVWRLYGTNEELSAAWEYINQIKRERKS